MKQQAATVRLDKLLASAGMASRRGIKLFLKEHEVTVDDKRVHESGIRVSPSQRVLIDGKPIKKPRFVYFLLNKPIGIISSTADEFARDTVTTLIDTTERIYPVGRLDKDSHGLVLLTNNGELTHQLIHPRYHVPKVYRITVAGGANGYGSIIPTRPLFRMCIQPFTPAVFYRVSKICNTRFEI